MPPKATQNFSHLKGLKREKPLQKVRRQVGDLLMAAKCPFTYCEGFSVGVGLYQLVPKTPNHQPLKTNHKKRFLGGSSNLKGPQGFVFFVFHWCHWYLPPSSRAQAEPSELQRHLVGTFAHLHGWDAPNETKMGKWGHW